MFGDIPSGWAFGRMGRPAMRRPNPYSGLVDGLSAGELEADLVPVVHAIDEPVEISVPPDFHAYLTLFPD